MPIIARWRIPPESSWGTGWRAGSRAGIVYRAQPVDGPRPSALAGSCRGASRHLGELPADPLVGLNEVIGSWNTIAMEVPRRWR